MCSPNSFTATSCGVGFSYNSIWYPPHSRPGVARGISTPSLEVHVIWNRLRGRDVESVSRLLRFVVARVVSVRQNSDRSIKSTRRRDQN